MLQAAADRARMGGGVLAESTTAPLAAGAASPKETVNADNSHGVLAIT
jgi:hypothetical protein